MSVEQMLSAGLELTVREAIMTMSAREYTKRRGAPEVSQQLAEEKGVAGQLRQQLEALTLMHKGCAEREAQLQTDLEGVRGELTKNLSLLKAARAREGDLAEELRRLKLERKKLGEQVDDLTERDEKLSTDLLAANTENTRLSGELIKANETIVKLDTMSIIEHEEGFNKAMRHAAFLLKVDPLAVGFDMNQDVYGEEMRPIEGEEEIDFESEKGGADRGEDAATGEGPGAGEDAAEDGAGADDGAN